jgi:DNA-binding NarL/FixJ family response regulator
VVTRHGLTRAQARVLALLATGTSNRAIAAQLGISERTVEVHVTALLNELDADNRAGLIAFVLGR